MNHSCYSSSDFSFETTHTLDDRKEYSHGNGSRQYQQLSTEIPMGRLGRAWQGRRKPCIQYIFTTALLGRAHSKLPFKRNPFPSQLPVISFSLISFLSDATTLQLSPHRIQHDTQQSFVFQPWPMPFHPKSHTM